MPTVSFRVNRPRRRRGLRPPRLVAVGLGLRRAFLALLTALLLAGAGLVTFSVLSGSWTIAPILSGSMRPGFPVGGVVVAERIPITDLAVRDVVIFQNPYHPSEQMVHRIVQLKFDASGRPVVKTKGDANPVDDPWTITLKGRSIYVAQFTLPLLGYAAVGTNHGVDLMVGGVVLLLVVVSSAMIHERRASEEKARTDLRAPWPVGVATATVDDSKPGKSRASHPATPVVAATRMPAPQPPAGVNVVAHRSDPDAAMAGPPRSRTSGPEETR